MTSRATHPLQQTPPAAVVPLPVLKYPDKHPESPTKPNRSTPNVKERCLTEDSQNFDPLAGVRIPLVLHSDRPHQSAHQPLALGSHCLLLNLNARPLPPPQTPVQDTCEQITPLPAFTASHFSPFTFHFLYIFLSIQCNNTRYTHSLPTLLAL